MISFKGIHRTFLLEMKKNKKKLRENEGHFVEENIKFFYLKRKTENVNLKKIDIFFLFGKVCVVAMSIKVTNI